MHTYQIAGAEETSLNDLIDRIRGITARKPIRVSIPTFSRHDEPEGSSLRSLGVDETPLDRGLRKLADSLPEQFPDDGVGAMHHKRFWADISGSSHSAQSLMSLFRERVDDIMPIDFSAEPGAPSKIRRGMTMTMKLPLRGHVQIRVEKDEPAHIVFATIEGHPIAGMVEFAARDLPGGIVRFEIDNFARAANILDYAALRSIGEAAQSANWRTVVQNMIEASGGMSDGVHVRTQKLTEAQVAQIENDVRAMVRERRRAESSPAERPA